MTIAEAREMELDSPAVLGGIFTSVKKLTTRRGEAMARGQLEDLTGMIEVIFYPRAYQEYKPLIKPDEVVRLRGRLNVNGEEIKMVAEELFPMVKKQTGDVYLQLEQTSLDLITRLQMILRSYPGFSPVYLYFPRDRKLARAPEEFWLDLSSPALLKLKELLGSENVRVKEDGLRAF
jgi:DNA polymerase-3 subunit alpha